MFTITLKEARRRLTLILKRREGYFSSKSKRELLKELIDLVYKSGHHDGWYDHVEATKKIRKKK